MSSERPFQRVQKRLVDDWKHPVGTPVIVHRDDGTELETVTESMPWMLGASSQSIGHTAVISVQGISGGFLLERMRVGRP